MQSLQPGDSILFERGSVFEGELKILASGKSGNEIYVGAFGSGAQPIIRGSAEIKNWTLFRGNIWVADCAECISEPGNLFIDGRYQPLGRYPNDGYMTLSCNSKCKTSLTDHNHALADGYWDGAEVVVKSSRWTLDNLRVSNYFNETFYFQMDASYPLQNGYGYFIQKHLATLDKPGEWFFDNSSRKIFLYCHGGDKPGNHVIAASITDTGLRMNGVNFITIENLDFRHQRVLGAEIKHCANILFRNCVIEYAGINGLEVTSCQNPVVEHCRIENSNNNGVEWHDNANGSFTGNYIQRTGLHPGHGKSGNGTYIGLSIAANNQSGKNLFQYNSIDSTGYIGIDFRTGGTSIKNNLISNFCMIKDDGAGIYTWGNSHGDNKIEDNIILRGVGCGAGTGDSDHLWASGIYIDDRSSDIDVSGNTVAYCAASGIYIHNSKRVLLRRNKLFENANGLVSRDKGQLCIKLDALAEMPDKNLNLQVTENLFATMQEGNHCVYLSAEREQDLAAPGIFDENQYITPNSNQVIAKFYGRQEWCDATEELTLSDWQRCTDRDKNSQFKKITDAKGEPAGLNMIRNGSMTNSTQGWISWPQRVSIVHDKRIGENGASLQAHFPPGESEGLLYYAGINLDRNKTYRLTFSAKSKSKSRIEFAPLMAVAPWDALGEYKCFPIDSAFKSFTYLFRPNKSFDEARLNFKGNSTFWIDNVALIEVGSGSQKKETIQLFYNASEKQKTISLSGDFRDLDGRPISNQITLPAYGSIILRTPNK